MRARKCPVWLSGEVAADHPGGRKIGWLPVAAAGGGSLAATLPGRPALMVKVNRTSMAMTVSGLPFAGHADMRWQAVISRQAGAGVINGSVAAQRSTAAAATRLRLLTRPGGATTMCLREICGRIIGGATLPLGESRSFVGRALVRSGGAACCSSPAAGTQAKEAGERGLPPQPRAPTIRQQTWRPAHPRREDRIAPAPRRATGGDDRAADRHALDLGTVRPRYGSLAFSACC